MSANFKNINQLPNRQNQESWLTKDRFWNFVFWFGMSGGFSFATFVKFTLGLPEFVPYILILNIIIFPILIMYFNKTNVFKKRIVNSENIKLKKKQWPTALLIPITIISIVITGFLADKYATIGSAFSNFISFSALLSGFCLYFIVKNCPITILFNFKFWSFVVISSDDCYDDNFINNNRRNDPFMSNNHYQDTRYNPSKSYHPSNIYYSSRHK